MWNCCARSQPAATRIATLILLNDWASLPLINHLYLPRFLVQQPRAPSRAAPHHTPYCHQPSYCIERENETSIYVFAIRLKLFWRADNLVLCCSDLDSWSSTPPSPPYHDDYLSPEIYRYALRPPSSFSRSLSIPRQINILCPFNNLRFNLVLNLFSPFFSTHRHSKVRYLTGGYTL